MGSEQVDLEIKYSTGDPRFCSSQMKVWSWLNGHSVKSAWYLRSHFLLLVIYYSAVAEHTRTHIYTEGGREGDWDGIFACSILSLSLITYHLLSLPLPHLSTYWSPLLHKLLRIVRALTTGQLYIQSTCLVPCSQSFPSPSLPPLLSPPSVVEKANKSNFPTYNLMDGVVSL